MFDRQNNDRALKIIHKQKPKGQAITISSTPSYLKNTKKVVSSLSPNYLIQGLRQLSLTQEMGENPKQNRLHVPNMYYNK